MDDQNSSTSGATEATAPAKRAHHAGDGGADRGFEHPDGLEAGEAVDARLGPVGAQPVHVMADTRAAGLDAPVIGVGGLMAGRIGGLIEIRRDLCVQRFLVAFQRQQVIRAALQDGVGDAVLTARSAARSNRVWMAPAGKGFVRVWRLVGRGHVYGV